MTNLLWLPIPVYESEKCDGGFRIIFAIFGPIIGKTNTEEIMKMPITSGYIEISGREFFKDVNLFCIYDLGINPMIIIDMVTAMNGNVAAVERIPPSE